MPNHAGETLLYNTVSSASMIHFFLQITLWKKVCIFPVPDLKLDHLLVCMNFIKMKSNIFYCKPIKILFSHPLIVKRWLLANQHSFYILWECQMICCVYFVSVLELDTGLIVGNFVNVKWVVFSWPEFPEFWQKGMLSLLWFVRMTTDNIKWYSYT